MVKRGKKTKYLFVTGGVVSSLGKGLVGGVDRRAPGEPRDRGQHLKLDPYINVDPGTMSPYQHGEVFVTDDGAETDLDLGHYERFTTAKMTRKNNYTTGRIYERHPARAAGRVPRQDRAGDPAHHRRDQGGDPRGGRRRRHLDRRDGRHGRRHRVAAVPRGHPADEGRGGRGERGLRRTSPWSRSSPRRGSSRPSPPSTR